MLRTIPPSTPLSTLLWTPGVYFLYQGKELVYVGQSGFIEARIYQHFQNQAMTFDRYSFIRIDNKQERLRQESAFIKELRPPANNRPKFGRNRITVACRLEPTVFAVIQRLAEESDRTISRVIERLLATHPRVQEQMRMQMEATA